MKSREQVAKIQRAFNENMRRETVNFIATIAKSDLSAVLLSGSTARGDFYPGPFGGMVDLTVMSKLGSRVKASDIFGENENLDIPFHCVKRNGVWYQIAFHEFVECAKFQLFDEARKFAFLESEILWEEHGVHSTELETIREYSSIDQSIIKRGCIEYINYLLSEYKEDRWLRRDAYAQLHTNLNTAVQLAIRCLFYINQFYAPAEDRRLYYTYSLPNIPDDFESLMESIHRQDILSESDFERRKKLFTEKLLPFVE